MITPADIENKEFSRAVRGYKEEEVDTFLDLIIVDMEKLMRENRQLKVELEKAHGQVDKHVSSEASVYETLEAAKSLMNDIAASAERRAEILLKNAELEANLITREARESVSKLTDEGNRLRLRVDNLKDRYRQLLEAELDRLDFSGNDIFEEFERDFMPASMTELSDLVEEKPDTKQPIEGETKETSEKVVVAEDLSKTMVNIR